MNEFDKRQLNLMQSKIHDFKSNRLHISNFIYDLESLLNILEQKDQEWKSLFRGYWWDLEQVYAVAIDRSEFNITPEENIIIDNAVSKIEKLIETKLKKTSIYKIIKFYLLVIFKFLRLSRIKVETRALKRACEKGYSFGTEEFSEWMRLNGPNPRGIPPMVVEAEIANSRSTSIQVILNKNGNAVTVIPEKK